jgi:hypothetical protein
LPSSRAGRWARASLAFAALVVVLPAIAGCGGKAAAGASPARVPARVPADDAPVGAAAGAGAAQPWCDDTDWLIPAAAMYVSVYRKKHRPITASRIEGDLADGGPLWKAYRRLAGEGTPPDTGALREFLTEVAVAEDAGTGPLAYAHHIVAVCDS